MIVWPLGILFQMQDIAPHNVVQDLSVISQSVLGFVGLPSSD
jgi:hypothetical protein